MTTKEGGLRGSIRNVGVGVSEIPDSVIDNFEEVVYEDQGNTLGDYYTGDLASFTRDTTSPVQSGSYSLKGTGTDQTIYSTSGLNTYPTRGDSFKAHIYLNSSGANAGFRWGGPDINNCYETMAFEEFDNVILYRIDSGSRTNIASGTVSFPTGEWLRIEVDFNSPNIAVRVYDSADNLLGSASTDDSTYSSSGFGWRNDETEGAAFDTAELI